jgi:cysteine desulfurase / selenocysteine lyase
MDLRRIRQDFPILQNNASKKPVIYFDTACQSLRPTQVIEALNQYYLKEQACAGRSMHQLSAAVNHDVDQARAALAKFFNASKKEEIVFTRNTTEGINLVANALDFQPGDVVLIGDKEHNSNLIPWQMLAKKRGIQVKVIPSNPDNTFNLSAFEAQLAAPVKLVSLGWTSNLDGVSLPVVEIVKKTHKNGALVLFDAAQAAPHQPINLKSLDVDFLALSGHKMLGPSGTGLLYGKLALLEKMEPFMVGGETVARSTYTTCEFLPPPEKFEAGLQDYAGIIGFAAAAKYLQGIGFDAIQKQEHLVNECLTTGIKDIQGLKLIGPADPRLRGGILSFYIEDIDSHRIALMLDQMAGIAVRSGQHCVHSWFDAHKVTGSVRASTYFYNTVEEAELFIANLKKIRKVL